MRKTTRKTVSILFSLLVVTAMSWLLSACGKATINGQSPGSFYNQFTYSKTSDPTNPYHYLRSQMTPIGTANSSMVNAEVRIFLNTDQSYSLEYREYQGAMQSYFVAVTGNWNVNDQIVQLAGTDGQIQSSQQDSGKSNLFYVPQRDFNTSGVNGTQIQVYYVSAAQGPVSLN